MSSKRWAGVARLGGVGDNLIAASVLRPLKKLGYMVEVIGSTSDPHCVFLNNPFIDKLSLKADGDIVGDRTKWFATRGREYDIFADLSHSCEYRHALFENQTQFWLPQDYRRKLCAGSYLETVHDIVGVPYEFGPLFFPTEEERERAQRTRDEQIGGPYIAWVISGSRVDKIHPHAPLIIARIIKELDIPVVMIGIGDKQFAMAKQIAEYVEHHNSSSKGIHLALSPATADPGGHQDWSIRRSLTQALAAKLVVTPDTGVAWASAMEDLPKVVLLSHASAENITKHWRNTLTLSADRWRVPCFPCHRLHNTIETCVSNKDNNGAACISDLSVECIMSAVKLGLGQADARDRLQKEFASNVSGLSGFASQ